MFSQRCAKQVTMLHRAMQSGGFCISRMASLVKGTPISAVLYWVGHSIAVMRQGCEAYT